MLVLFSALFFVAESMLVSKRGGLLLLKTQQNKNYVAEGRGGAQVNEENLMFCSVQAGFLTHWWAGALSLALVCGLGCVGWQAVKWLGWKRCERTADSSLFYRVCRVKYGIKGKEDLAFEENQRRVAEAAQGYKRFSHCSIEQLGRILDRQNSKYEALRHRK